MTGEFEGYLYVASTWALPLLFAITLHEAAHGFAAYRLGDDTAKKRGRVTLNPLRHIDPVGTVLLPSVLIVSPLPFVFGYAKPVPVAFHKLRRPRRDMVLVAAAGPVANILIALVSALLIWLTHLIPASGARWLILNCTHSILINLLLAVFNMLPLPPLDGGRVAVGLLPDFVARPLARLERYGLLILVAALFLLPYLSRQLGFEVNVFHWLVWAPVEQMLPFFLELGGLAIRGVP